MIACLAVSSWSDNLRGIHIAVIDIILTNTMSAEHAVLGLGVIGAFTGCGKK